MNGCSWIIRRRFRDLIDDAGRMIDALRLWLAVYNGA
jgi:hypothetical protein